VAAVHHEDDPGLDLGIFHHGPLDAPQGSHDDIIQIPFAFPVPEHGIEPQFLQSQVARAVAAANNAFDRFLNRFGRGLDKFGPAIKIIVHVGKVFVFPVTGHGNHLFKIPVIITGQFNPLLMRNSPQNVRLNRLAQMEVQLDELLALALGFYHRTFLTQTPLEGKFKKITLH